MFSLVIEARGTAVNKREGAARRDKRITLVARRYELIVGPASAAIGHARTQAETKHGETCHGVLETFCVGVAVPAIGTTAVHPHRLADTHAAAALARHRGIHWPETAQ